MRYGLAFLLVVACEAAPDTYTAINDEVLIPSCGFSSCHGSGTGDLTLDENSYDDLVDVASSVKPGAIRVVPGDADASYLVHKLEGGPDIVDDPMPQGGSLSDAQIAGIRRWIDNGALRD